MTAKMPDIAFDKVQVGQSLPEHVCGPISRTTLALFAGGSGDHNPIHVDIDFAKASGMPDVFAHGMLSMAYLGQLITRWVPPERLRSWNVRFVAITPVHARVICAGEIIEKFEAEGERCVRLRLGARTDGGLETLAGEAVVALP